MPARLTHVAVDLELLWCGDLTVPPGWFFGASGPTAALRALGAGVPRSEWLRSPVGAFLVRHPTAGPILIDTGLHPSVSADRNADFGRLNGLAFSTLKTSPERSVSAQLRARGIDAPEIAMVVMTHLHVDHASGMSELPNAEFVCSTREWEAATARLGPYYGYHRPQLPPPGRVRQIDFSGSSTVAHSSFERTVDLLGDGSVRLLSTPGHTHGHLSVLLQLKTRQALVIGDAVYTLRNLRENRRPHRVLDGAGYDRSAEEIRAFERAHPEALLIPTHDQGVWEQAYGDAPRDLHRAVA